MIATINRTQNFNATSQVSLEDGTMQTVMYMNASIGERGEASFNYQIEDTKRYKEHQVEADADFEEFKAKVMGYAG